MTNRTVCGRVQMSAPASTFELWWQEWLDKLAHVCAERESRWAGLKNL
jgi:hypothetical protein